MNKFQAQLDAICRKPYLKPAKPLTGIEKHFMGQVLDEITRDYEEMFKK